MLDRQKKSAITNIRKKKRRAAPLFGLWLFLLIAAAGLTVLLLNLEYFSVRYISIEGNRIVSSEDILELGVLTTGENIFRLDTSVAIQKISKHPQIKHVVAVRKLPQEITYKITERYPYAYVLGPDGFIVIDDEMFYLYKLTGMNDMTLPVISGIEIEANTIPGSKLGSPGLQAALKLIELLGQGTMKDMSEVVAKSPETLTLKTLQGIEIIFCTVEDFERKINMMQELLIENSAIFNDQTIEYIDLRYNTSPVIKRKN